MGEQFTLDYLAALTAQGIVDGLTRENGKAKPRELETLVTKALGVLQSQGVYALALFLFSRSGTKKEPSKAEELIATTLLARLWNIREPLAALQKLKEKGQSQLEGQVAQVNSNKNEWLKGFAELSKNLDDLLLVRDLYEQTLIYTRYLAKAMDGTGESSVSG